MKKLFSLIMLLLATVFATNALAQHVYINDPCVEGKPSSTFWNPHRISDIGAVTGFTSDGLPWPAWFYDANGDIFGSPVTDKVDGLSIVESNVIHVNETGEMFFKMDFYVRTSAKSNMRNFGARIRINSGTEWDTLFTLRKDGIFPAYSGYEGRAEISIGDKYNGKNVVLQIFFYNDALATDAFVVAFNNVFLASYGYEPKVETQLLSPRVASGNVYKGRLNCINQSLTSIKSVEYAYSVNGKAEKKQAVTFADSLKIKGASSIIDFVFDITEADIDTTNLIQIWPVAVDGKAYTPGDTLGFSLTVVNESRLDQNYVPMLECFTSATCKPCRELNPTLNPVLAELKGAGKLNVVKYQVNWPAPGDKYYISDNGIRVDYYGVSGAPTLVFNGMERPLKEWNMSTYDNLMNDMREKADAASQNKAFFTIKVNKAEVTPQSIVELDFDVTSHLPTRVQLTIHALVIEGTTHGNRVVKSETDFHYVNMAFATPAEGRNSYFSQERTNNYTYTVDMKDTHMEESTDLQVVIFVQDPENKYIYQSACVLMGPGEMTAVEDEDLAQVSIYPNPASQTVNVAGLEKARVEIFDLGGRKVYENASADGVLEVSLASFAKGAYVVRIAQNGAVASRKLVVR